MPGPLFTLDVAEGFKEPLQHARFVGRSRELSALTELIAERRSATVLVAGFRGAGKTALVDHALKTAGSKDQLVVRLAPPSVTGDEGGRSSVRAQVLRSLARGLYFAVAGNGSDVSKSIQLQAEATYEKTYLTEMESHALVETVASAEANRSEAATVRATFEGSKAARMVAGGLAMGVVSSLGVASALGIADRFGSFWGVVTFLVVVVTALLAATQLERTTESTGTTVDELTNKDSRSNVGRLDLSEETLEFELRRTLQALSDEGVRVVFVLDELDKLEQLPGDHPRVLEESPVFKIVASLKNFFSLGNAVYIFITDDEFFERLALQQRGSGYSLSHTLFTDRFFVGPLHYRDLEKLVDLSVAGPPANPEEVELFERFKNFVCWESNNHVFDAIQTIGSYTVVSNSRPLLAPSESGPIDGVWQEGSLPSNWLDRAALQKHVGVAFDEARRGGRGDALYTQALWESLHTTAEALLDDEEIMVVDDDVVDVKGRMITGLSRIDRAGVASAVHRMLIRMERHGSVTDATRKLVEADNDPVPDGATEGISYSLNQTVPYPPSSIANETTLLPTEETLLDLARRLRGIYDNCGELVELGDDDTADLESVEAVARSVQETGPRRTVRRALVARTIPAAGRLAEGILRASLNGLVEAWCTENGYDHATALTGAHPRTGAWKQALTTNFGPIATVLETIDSGYYLVGGSGSENGLLVLPMPTAQDVGSVQRAYRRCLSGNEKDREQRKHLLPIVHIVLDTEASEPIPTEMVQVIEEVAARGFWSTFFGGAGGTSTRKRQEERPLEGWHQFALLQDASNLGKLKESLDGASYLRDE